MNILQIPFVQKVGIAKNAHDTFILAPCIDNHNHIGTVHASAQFTLAETALGAYLLENFPHLLGIAVPLLRESHMKYKKPSANTLYAKAFVSDEEKEKFQNQFDKKGRALITVAVEILDDENVAVSHGTFEWFVQKTPA